MCELGVSLSDSFRPMNEVQMRISMDYYENSFYKGILTKKTNPNLLEAYIKAINDRLRQIHGYQSAKMLFELTQTTRKILT